MRLARGTVVGTAVAVAAVAGAVAVGVAGSSAAATARAVLPVAETQVFPSGSGDIADDSAIWVDASDPANSVVLADNKAGSGGVATYDLAGRLLQYLPVGQVGNIDVRDGVPLGGGPVALVGAINRTTNTIMFWTLDRVTHALHLPLTTFGWEAGASFHAHTMGLLPFAWNRGAPDEVAYVVTR